MTKPLAEIKPVTGTGRGFSLALSLLLLSLVSSSALAQTKAYYENGRGASPVYEGWLNNSDGSFTMMFGYMNDNWEEELNVPIGPNNSISPGAADQGQPTHFLPRRNRYVFRIRVPADFGNQELVWTLITKEGLTHQAYGSLRKDYGVEPITMMSEGGTVGGGANNADDVQTNTPPEVTLEGAEMRTARVGEPLQLVAIVNDDDKPNPRGYRESVVSSRQGSGFTEDESPRERFDKAMRPPIRGTVNRVVGMYFSWFVYRGKGNVTFEPLQAKPWEDTRAFQNSAWSPFWVSPEVPEDGRWEATATFNQPGTYIIRGRADDGGLIDDVEVTVQVSE
jgi:hypothetical protein